MGGRRSRPTWAARTTRSAAPAASPPCGISPGCSTATRSTGPSCCCALGRRGRTTTTGRRELWRRLRARIGVPSPAERLADGVRAAARGARPGRAPAAGRAVRPDAPARGRPRGAARARRAQRDVHLFVLHPSPALWDAIARRRAGRPPRRRPDGGAAAQPAARLVGERRARAAARRRRRRRPPTTTIPSRTPRARCSPGSRPTSAPTARRRATRARPGRPQRAGPRLPRPRAPGRGAARRDPAPARRGPDARAARRDRHVPGHRDVRAADPRDVRRGRGDEDEDDALPAELRPPDLRVRLADRSLRQTNPVLGAVAGLLDLADARLTASQVLDLADREPVRRRFRLDDDDVGAARGLGRRERDPLGAGRRAPGAVQARRVPAGTWRRGLDRLLLGVTMTEDERADRRRRAAARRRRQRRDRPRRALRRARRPARDRARRASPGRSRSRAGPRRWPTPPTRCAPPAARRLAARASSQRLLDAASPRRAGTTRRSRCPRSARCSPSGSRAARRARTSAPAT